MLIKGKRLIDAYKNFTRINKYQFNDAAVLVIESSKKRFDETVDLAINLGVDPKKSDQMVRGACVYPHGTGKQVRVLAIVPADKIEEAKAAGAEYVGNDEYIDKIQKEGWIDFDKMVTCPQMMAQIGKLGKVLGRRGLMPNPKLGTVSNDIAAAIKLVKAGRVEFKVNKEGILCVPIGKISFGRQKLYDNALELVKTLMRLKPSTAKGSFIRKMTISSTMGPGVKLDENELINAAK
jgi:large subunit ribosomal protein L1